MTENYLGRKVMVIQTIITSDWYKFGDIFKVKHVIADGPTTGLVVDNGRVLLLSEVVFLD